MPQTRQTETEDRRAPPSTGTVGNVANYDQTSARYVLSHPKVLARFLDLSSAQMTTLLSLTTTREQTVKPLWQARAPPCQSLETDLDASSPDTAAIGVATLALYDNHEQIVAARQTFVTAFSAIL